MNYHPRVAFDDRGGSFRTSARSAFIRAKKLEMNYGARLRKVARHIGDIVREFADGTPASDLFIQSAMEKYATLLGPWAEAVAERMVTEVAQSDRMSWRKVSAQMGRALHKEIQEAPTGMAMRRLMGEQVGLITSLPRDAAERVHKLTQEGITQGRRAAEIAAEIAQTGEVTKSRATLIARTEVGRTATTLTQARAEYVGSTQYVWRTVGDSDVRPGHRALNGKVISWNDPPECDPGHRAHAGAIFNCRCYPEPILAD